MSGPDTAFILSSGRTGTKFLAHYFDANYADVVARHEPPPSRLLRMASHAHMVGRVGDETLVWLLRRKRRRHVAPLSAPLYVESNPFLSGFIEVLGEVFPDPLVVHVVRDPREHARSSLNHGTASGLKGFANRFAPFWYPDVRRLLSLGHAPGPIERAAGLWRIVNELLGEKGPRHARYHRLRYEELFDAERSGLRALCGVLGLPFREDAAVSPNERINPGRLDVLPPWSQWSPAQCRALQAVCGPLMQELGYGREPEWLERTRGDD